LLGKMIGHLVSKTNTLTTMVLKHSIESMRYMLNMEDDLPKKVNRLAKAERSNEDLGQQVSDTEEITQYRNGVPLFPSRGEVVTMEHIQKIMDEEGI